MARAFREFREGRFGGGFLEAGIRTWLIGRLVVVAMRLGIFLRVGSNF
jgi:hypothetical protein